MKYYTKIITLLILCSIALFSKEIKNKNWLSYYLGNSSFNQKTLLFDGNINLKDEKTKTFQAIKLTNTFWMKPYEKTILKISLDSYKYTNYYNPIKYVDNNSTNENNIYQGLDISDMTLNYYINNDNVITFGIIDSTRGRTSEFVSGIQSNSPILPQIASGRIEGAFYSHYTEKTDFKLGFHKEGLFSSIDSQNSEDIGSVDSDGSKYYFTTFLYKFKENYSIVFNAAYSELDNFQIYDNTKTIIPSGKTNLDIGNTLGTGINIIYGTEDYGTYYGSFLYNESHFDTTALSPTRQPLRFNDVVFDKSNAYAEGLVLGYSDIYDSNFLKREIHYGFEYFKTKGDWYSYNNNYFLNQSGVDQGGESYSIYSRIFVNKNLNIGITYYDADLDGTNKLISAEKKKLSRKQKNEYLQITYIF